MEQLQKTGFERLEQIAEVMSAANLAYLHNCVEFWRGIRPECSLKDWLSFSVRRSTNRVGTGTLGAMLPQLNDEDILWLNENWAVSDARL